MKQILILAAVLAVLLSPFGGVGGGLFAQALPGAGNCLQYNGTSDYVDCGDATAFRFGTGNFTLECWFYFNGTPQRGTIVAKRNYVSGSGLYQYGLYLNESPYSAAIGSKVSAFIRPDAAALGPPPTEDRVVTSPVISTGWHHIAMVNTYASQLELFVDGVSIGTDVTSFNGKTINISGKSFQVGSGNTVLFINASIDEVRIWNTARTQTQIRDNMCQKLVGNEAGLVGYWRFDETNGNTAFDSSPNGNNGTLW